MRIAIRSRIFVLSLCLGTISWLVLARGSTAPLEAAQEPGSSPVPPTGLAPLSKEQQVSQAELMSFEEVGPLSGYTSTERLQLRKAADANSPVVATLKVELDTQVKILDATRDFLLVRISTTIERDDGESSEATYEGWTAWGSVMPYMSALVLDAETGVVVGRVPLNEAQTSVAYAPDGTRAIFYTTYNDESMVMAYEVRTDDYSRTRSIVSHSTKWLPPLFYGSDSQLNAFALSSADAASRLHVISLGNSGNLSEPTAISAAVTDFIVSHDGRTGFIYHPQESGAKEEEPFAALDVVDLGTHRIRNTIKLRGPQTRPGDGLLVNRDGTELYFYQDEDTITVIDTRTGEVVRELPKKLPAHVGSNFIPANPVGDSLSIYYWGESSEETHERGRTGWLTSKGFVAADEGVAIAVEVGGARYAVNDEGTLLFKLDKHNRIQERHAVERPDIRPDGLSVNYLTTSDLAASPDGKHLIVFVGIVHGC